VNLSLEFLGIALIAGVVHLDTMAFLQSMISRPIVAGPIIGSAIGRPESGLLIGCIMELVYISSVTIGVKIPSDATAATVMAVVCAGVPDGRYAAVGTPVAMLVGTLMGTAYTFMDVRIKHANSVSLGWVDTAKPELVDARVTALVQRGLVTVYLGSVLFYLALLPLVQFAVKMVSEAVLALGMERAFAAGVWLLPAVGIGVGLAHFTEE